MDEIKKKMRFLFSCIEINLVLWLVVLGTIKDGNVSKNDKILFFGCFIFAALLQHWAYYNLYKTTRNVK